MVDPVLLARIEESLTRLDHRPVVTSKVDIQIEQAILAREKRAEKAGTLYTYVCEKIRLQSHFVKKNGKLDESGFYVYAHIDKTTWSNLRWGLRVPSKETLLKLVFALRLNEEDARELMRRGSNSLNEADPRDRVVLALLDISCYDIQLVYEVLEEYGTNGAQPFKNIYADVRE